MNNKTKYSLEQKQQHLIEFIKKPRWTTWDIQFYIYYCIEQEIIWFEAERHIIYYMLNCKFDDNETLESINKLQRMHFSVKPIWQAFSALREVILIESTQEIASSPEAIKSRYEIATNQKLSKNAAAIFFINEVYMEGNTTMGGAVEYSRYLTSSFLRENISILMVEMPKFRTQMVFYDSIKQLKDKDNGADVRKETVKKLQEIQMITESQLAYDMNSCYAKHLEGYLNKLCTPEYYNNVNLIEFGYKRWETLIDRGLDHSTVHILAGRPGSGKTLFMVNLLSGLMLQDIPVAIISLETETAKIIEKLFRIQNSESFIFPSNKTMYDRDSTFWDAQFDKVKGYVKGLTAKKAYFHFNPSTTIEELEEILINTSKKIGTRVVFIDYFQMLGVAGERFGSYEKLSYVAQKLKYFSVKYNLCIILLVQLNRTQERAASTIINFNTQTVKEKIEQFEPSLADLKGTSDLEQIAESVTFIVRHNALESHATLDTESVKSKEQKNKDILQLIVKKNRHGRCGSITCKINLETLQIREEFRKVTRQERRIIELQTMTGGMVVEGKSKMPINAIDLAEMMRIQSILQDLNVKEQVSSPQSLLNQERDALNIALKNIMYKNGHRMYFLMTLPHKADTDEEGTNEYWYDVAKALQNEKKRYIHQSDFVTADINPVLERKSIFAWAKQRKEEGTNLKSLSEKKKNNNPFKKKK